MILHVFSSDSIRYTKVAQVQIYTVHLTLRMRLIIP